MLAEADGEDFECLRDVEADVGDAVRDEGDDDGEDGGADDVDV